MIWAVQSSLYHGLKLEYYLNHSFFIFQSMKQSFGPEMILTALALLPGSVLSRLQSLVSVSNTNKAQDGFD